MSEHPSLTRNTSSLNKERSESLIAIDKNE